MREDLKHPRCLEHELYERDPSFLSPTVTWPCSWCTLLLAVTCPIYIRTFTCTTLENYMYLIFWFTSQMNELCTISKNSLREPHSSPSKELYHFCNSIINRTLINQGSSSQCAFSTLTKSQVINIA